MDILYRDHFHANIEFNVSHHRVHKKEKEGQLDDNREREEKIVHDHSM